MAGREVGGQTAGRTDPAASEVPPPTGGLARDAAITIIARVGLAILIFATDVVLARLLGPAAKGRFTLVLLYSQLAAVVVGWGMDQALAVVSGRGRDDARRGLANAVVWAAVVGGFSVVLSGWLYGIHVPGPPAGPLSQLIPNLSGAQFAYAALAIPGELFFALGINALLGRRRVAGYATVRLLRRSALLVLLVSTAAIARLSLDVALVLNLVSLGFTALAILVASSRDGLVAPVPSLRLLREELAFGSRSVLGALAERLQFRADAFLLNAFVGVRATGIYSVTSGLAETLWYIPNSLGVVMFSRAVDPRSDAGRVAAILTRTTVFVVIALAVPLFVLGPRLVRFLYGTTFADAGVALRWIIPGVIAYSVVAVLSRYIVGRGRPGTATALLVVGLVANVATNLVLIPRLGIVGAAAASSISYAVTALLALLVFRRLSGRGIVETLVIRRADLEALARLARSIAGRVVPAPAVERTTLPGESAVTDIVVHEHEPGEEP